MHPRYSYSGRDARAYGRQRDAIATLLEDHPQLSEEDVRDALRFAAARVDERTIALDLTA